MDLEFSEVNFSGIGMPTSSADSMWGKLELRFRDAETDRFVSTELVLFLPRGPNVTFAELQSAARDHAKTILRAALACLEDRDIEGLQEKSDRQQHHADRCQ